MENESPPAERVNENIEIGRAFREAVYPVFDKYTARGVPTRRLLQILTGTVTAIGLELKARAFMKLFKTKEKSDEYRQG